VRKIVPIGRIGRLVRRGGKNGVLQKGPPDSNRFTTWVPVSGVVRPKRVLANSWGRLRAKVNSARLAAGEPGIADLHFNDLRARASDDAEEAGQDRAKFLGNNPSVAHRHYARRITKLRPLK